MPLFIKPNLLITAALLITINQTSGSTLSHAAATAENNLNRQEWPLDGMTHHGARYSSLNQITAANVNQLGIAWEFRDFVVRGRTHRGVEANPIVTNGKMYFSGPWGVAYALNAKTGEHIWTYDPQADGQYARLTCCDAVSRGLAVSEGIVYSASLDGFLTALDADTGKVLWRVDTFYRRDWNYTISGAPQLAGENIIIGNGGADMGARGYVSAYNKQTGALAWRFWAVPGDPKTEPDENPDVTFARKSWPEDTLWNLGLGGNAWAGLAYDPETNTVFLGLGNGGPHPAWLRSKSGKVTDQLYLTSIVAVNNKTGRLKWYYQTTPGDSWDFAATAPMVLADLKINGEVRSVIMQAPKNGIFYVLDRNTGELLAANPYTPVNWTSGIDTNTGRPTFTTASDFRKSGKIIWPGVSGGHAWTPMAFSEHTGLVYLQVFEAPMRHITMEHINFKPGTAMDGAHNEFPPFNKPGDQELLAGMPTPVFQGQLKALDPLTGTAKWSVDSPSFINSGTLATKELVFWAGFDGYLKAFDSRTGEQKLNLFTGTSIMGAPITYAIDGTQYIAIMGGAGGPQGGFFPASVAASQYENFERLMVFKLNGKPIELPSPAAYPAQAALPNEIPATQEQLVHGQTLYQEHCHRCHLLGGSFGIYPNLWNMDSNTIIAFEAILKGAYRYAGMADFSDILKDEDIAAIKAFIVNDTIVKRTKGQDAGAQFKNASH